MRNRIHLQARRNKETGQTYLVANDGKCLHSYFYFFDEELGLCHLRVPTWLPCRLRVCLNGHNWLAARLPKLGLAADNAFTHSRHARLNDMARRCCLIYEDFAAGYHWSVDKGEYATDIVFRKQAELQAIYDNLTRTAIATFLGCKLSAQYEGEMGGSVANPES